MEGSTNKFMRNGGTWSFWRGIENGNPYIVIDGFLNQHAA
jgi:hypothetical protein